MEDSLDKTPSIYVDESDLKYEVDSEIIFANCNNCHFLIEQIQQSGKRKHLWKIAPSKGDWIIIHSVATLLHLFHFYKIYVDSANLGFNQLLSMHKFSKTL